MRRPLAPVVREEGVWTYQAPAPTDFFTLEALRRAWLEHYTLHAPEPTLPCAPSGLDD